MPDAERVDEPVEPDGPALLDGLEQLGDRLPAPAFAVDQPVGMRLQTEDVRRRSDQPVLPEGGDVLAAQALAVESGWRDEMLQPLARLRRADKAAGAEIGRGSCRDRVGRHV